MLASLLERSLKTTRAVHLSDVQRGGGKSQRRLDPKAQATRVFQQNVPGAIDISVEN
jgi:hypothetical protein